MTASNMSVIFNIPPQSNEWSNEILACFVFIWAISVTWLYALFGCAGHRHKIHTEQEVTPEWLHQMTTTTDQQTANADNPNLTSANQTDENLLLQPDETQKSKSHKYSFLKSITRLRAKTSPEAEKTAKSQPTQSTPKRRKVKVIRSGTSPPIIQPVEEVEELYEYAGGTPVAQEAQ